MTLLKKKVNGIDVPTDQDIYNFFHSECDCQCCEDEDYEDEEDESLAMDTIELVAQEVKDQGEKVEEVINGLQFLSRATLTTDELLADGFGELSKRFKLLTEYLGVEFEVIPEVPAIPEKTIIKKKTTKKKK